MYKYITKWLDPRQRYEVLDSPNSHTRYEVLDSPMQFLLHVSSDMKLTYDFLPKSMYI